MQIYSWPETTGTLVLDRTYKSSGGGSLMYSQPGFSYNYTHTSAGAASEPRDQLYALGINVWWHNLTSYFKQITPTSIYAAGSTSSATKWTTPTITTNGTTRVDVTVIPATLLAEYAMRMPARDDGVFLGNTLKAPVNEGQQPIWWSALTSGGDTWIRIRWTTSLVYHSVGSRVTKPSSGGNDRGPDPPTVVKSWTFESSAVNANSTASLVTSFTYPAMSFTFPAGSTWLPGSDLRTVFIPCRFWFNLTKCEIFDIEAQKVAATFEWPNTAWPLFAYPTRAVVGSRGSTWTYYNTNAYSYEYCISAAAFQINSAAGEQFVPQITSWESSYGWGASGRKTVGLGSNGAYQVYDSPMRVVITLCNNTPVNGRQVSYTAPYSSGEPEVVDTQYTVRTPQITVWSPPIEDTRGIIACNDKVIQSKVNDKFSEGFYKDGQTFVAPWTGDVPVLYYKKGLN